MKLEIIITNNSFYTKNIKLYKNLYKKTENISDRS